MYIKNSRKRANPYAGFNTANDMAALRLFKEGATLHRWRVSCPDNWWLTTPQGVEVELPKDDQAQDWGYSKNLEFRLVALGKRSSVSDEQVLRMNVAGGLYHGGPQCETWAFDAQRVAVLERQWAEVQAGLRERVTFSREPQASALRTLSDQAMSLLRLFKRSPSLYPYPETFAPMQELEAAGWIRLNADTLHFEAVPALTAAVLPKGPRATFVFGGREALPA